MFGSLPAAENLCSWPEVERFFSSGSFKIQATFSLFIITWKLHTAT